MMIALKDLPGTLIMLKEQNKKLDRKMTKAGDEKKFISSYTHYR